VAERSLSLCLTGARAGLLQDAKLLYAEVLDLSAAMLIPVPQPYGGVLAVGQYAITYVNGKVKKSIKMDAPRAFKVAPFLRICLARCGLQHLVPCDKDSRAP
jgi:hypothetical protein